MKLKKAILEHIGRDDLKRICERFEIEDVDQRSAESMRNKLSRAHRATAEILFEPLDEPAVKAIAERMGMSTTGRRAALIEALLQQQDQYPNNSEELSLEAGGVSDVEGAANQPRQERGARTRKAARSGTTEQYEHQQQAVQRPDVGVQDQFVTKKQPKTYRYDSSLDPSLSWDESRDRELAEWLLGLVERSANHGEESVFKSSQEWKGGGVKVDSTRAAIGLLRRLTKPFLNWTGKAERHQISVPTVPLFVHERHSTKAILEGIKNRQAKGTNLDLFGDARLDIADKLDAYEHQGPWQNRMILGDSLQIMNSMLEFEGVGGQVQMMYIDPPYGVNYGSNFQPFVRNRKVAASGDEDLTREPEMVKAYRDTWELGLHSYLTYLRDRLLLARELLHESGSVFVQISDANLHRVRTVLDEVFGSENFVACISFRTMTPLESGNIESVYDYLVWFAKDKSRLKYRNLFAEKSFQGNSEFKFLEVSPGKYRELSDEEMETLEDHPQRDRVFKRSVLESSGFTESCTFKYTFNGEAFNPRGGKSWRTTPEGMKKLDAKGRLFKLGTKLYFKLFHSDFPFGSLLNSWADTVAGYSKTKLYVVQTHPKVVQRCMLMTTDPGDLVFDPTCGSGTTAFVAEQWGRRWITCDTSRVPLALARQRILTATFPYYELKSPKLGPIGGFVYKRKQNRKGEEVGGLAPHITLKSIANDETPAMEILVDRPEQVGNVTRVSGPFVVEATIAPAQLPSKSNEGVSEAAGTDSGAAIHIDRMTQMLRQSHTLRLPENRVLVLENIRRLSDTEYVHAEAKQPDETRAVAVVFGPEDGTISSDVVYNAASEAHYLKYTQLFFFGFAIQAKARELLEDRKKLRILCTYVAVTPDVAMSDLLKTSRASEIFSVTGLPDFEVSLTGKTNEAGDRLYQVTLAGLDIFDPSTMKHDQIEGASVPAWMIDSDYDGMSFHATQVFFPKTSAWDNLQKSLKATFNESVWNHLAGTTSEPFALGERRRVAVKVIDERGNELMRVKDVA